MKPEYVEIDGIKFKINTDFRIALECERIAQNDSVGDYERSLAVIYKLFGEEGLNGIGKHEKLLEMAIKYLRCGKEADNKNNDEPDIDYEQDRGYIKASFFSDYKIPDVFSIEHLHWWDFCDYLNGLTEDSVLNRIRYVRNYDLSEIKDPKERKKWMEQKESVALKKKGKPLTDKQKESMDKFYKLTGIKRKE
jgi:hypothetical protein